MQYEVKTKQGNTYHVEHDQIEVFRALKKYTLRASDKKLLTEFIKAEKGESIEQISLVIFKREEKKHAPLRSSDQDLKRSRDRIKAKNT